MGTPKSTMPAATAVRPTSSAGTQMERPMSSMSRPGTSQGTTDRTCCTQCYKQISSAVQRTFEAGSQFANALEVGAIPKEFCSEACVERFQKALQDRRERERKLNELRSSMQAAEEASDSKDA